ncbi:hypothetical protein Pmani_037251 [Petrolisthes manimaculis]|uniref:Uncharacterized protein n=1 Tax=Petrolisthes manimaculis TaxID=1843537 RepID=A0AAE1NHM4_9EUCA|nr:hypothetical protein Pmani_037251 [Petrolisthes manimaculis]
MFDADGGMRSRAVIRNSTIQGLLASLEVTVSTNALPDRIEDATLASLSLLREESNDEVTAEVTTKVAGGGGGGGQITSTVSTSSSTSSSTTDMSSNPRVSTSSLTSVSETVSSGLSRSSSYSTTETPSYLGLQDQWVWFFLLLRGDNCRAIDNTNTSALFSDFASAFSSLLLYSKERVQVDGMACRDDRLTVNISVDSAYYPNCEADLKTLLEHKNLRVHLHNASFYIESYETKRSLIFETKPDLEVDKSEILFMTLSGVGVSIICIFFAAALFAIYQQCTSRRSNKMVISGTTAKFLPDSPRSLRPKMDMNQGVRYTGTHSYTVNMYKSYGDLSCQELYDEPSIPVVTVVSPGYNLQPPAPPNKQQQQKKKKKKQKGNNGDGLLVETVKRKQPHQHQQQQQHQHHHRQELWEGHVQHQEEFTAFRNVTNNNNNKTTSTSSFQPEDASSHPLLVNGHPNNNKNKNNKESAVGERNVNPMTNEKRKGIEGRGEVGRTIGGMIVTEECYYPTSTSSYPSSPAAIPRGVLERMDDLIFTTLSTGIHPDDIHHHQHHHHSSCTSFTTPITTNNNTNNNNNNNNNSFSTSTLSTTTTIPSYLSTTNSNEATTSFTNIPSTTNNNTTTTTTPPPPPPASAKPNRTNKRDPSTSTSSSSPPLAASTNSAKPLSPSTSSDNLCLTRITFMGMENPSFRLETDM